MRHQFISLSLILSLHTSLYAQQNLIPSSLSSGNSVVAHDKDYYKHTDEQNDVQIIYTEDNLPFAKQTATLESPLHEDYRDFYGWRLDETLYVGLISDYNQIANGFSTQWPNNRQINYIGGTSTVDYFTCTSWLNTLIFHETAHNYQVNVKGSRVSQGLHTLIGNGTFILPLIPIAVPNVMENSFMLEGNAVLNESWHGNGGRLYSGRLKAQTILQAEAGEIESGDVYNSKIAFPYGEIVYIQGGFYNLYMAQKYGMKELNSYFKYKSEDWWWPFLTNSSMYDAVGIDFEDSLESFADEYKALAKEFVRAEGELVASSQFFYSLGNSDDEIFFITNESGVRAPELVVLNKEMQKLSKTRDSYIGGKVIKLKDKYLTQGSRATSPTRVYQGLFDSRAMIEESTESKMVQGYLSDGEAVYFDVKSSFSQPQLYVGKSFYSRVNSSVIIDKSDNLYYFKQEGKTRTLYKNRTPLTSFEGFYGVVSDVDENGRVYFVANSELGSTLYSIKDSVVTRASSADNIVEARLINDDELLIAAISEKDYYYVKSGVEKINEEPYQTRLFFEDEEYYGEYKELKGLQKNRNDIDLSESYYSMLDMHYSGSDFFVGSVDGSTIGSLNVNFGDPLSQNSANLFVNRNESNITIAGAGYSNSQYLLEYSLSAYSVVEKSGREDTRDSGVIVNARLPFLQSGYYYGAFGLSYFQDFDTRLREPLSATFTLGHSEKYGVSMYSNSLNMLQLYGVLEREDKIVGAEYKLMHDLPLEFYISAGAKYSKTDSDTYVGTRGVKLSSISFGVDMDPSVIDIPSISQSYYVKEAGYGE
ncbi:MAG: hypothetical protein U9N39_03430, partial [Campylobacterota bacterium]|nr:hypothetical protein [Campylobacterota bacterium]